MIGSAPLQIGSGPRCDVRVEGPGAMPLHCVIAWENERLVIRRWSSKTLLNDEEFQAAELVCGDRLSVADIQFEIVLPSDAPLEDVDDIQTDPELAESSAGREVEPSEATDPDEQAAVRALADLRQRQNRDRGRVRALVQQLREERSGWVLERAEFEDHLDSIQSTLNLVTEELERKLAAEEVAARDIERLNQITEAANDEALQAREELGASAEQVSVLLDRIDQLETDLADAQRSTEHATPSESIDEQFSDPLHAAQDVGPESREASVEEQEGCEEVSEPRDQRAADAEEVATDPAFVTVQLEPEQVPKPEQPASPQAEGYGDLWAVERIAREATEQDEVATEEDPESAAESDAVEQEPTEEVSGDLAAESPTSQSLWGTLDPVAPQSEFVGTEASASFDSNAEKTVEIDPLQLLGTGSGHENQLTSEAASAAHESSVSDEALEATTAFDPPEVADTLESKPHEPESFLEKYAHLLPAEDEVNQPIEPLALEPVPETVQDTFEPTSEENEESVEQYMHRMMQRLRGEETDSSTEAVKPTSSVPTEAAATASAADQRTVVAEPEPQLIENLEELRGGVAPESGQDMDALRQVANQSARQAIDTSVVKVHKEHATLRLAFAVTSIAGGVISCLLAPTLTNPSMFVGLAAMMVGGYFLHRTYNTGVAKASREDADDWDAPE